MRARAVDDEESRQLHLAMPIQVKCMKDQLRGLKLSLVQIRRRPVRTPLVNRE